MKLLTYPLLFLSLFSFTSCSGLYYWPTSALYGDPWQADIPFENIFFESSDGTKLHAWLLKYKGDGPAKGLITFFHGNAQNLSSHAFILSWLTNHGFDLFIFDYRGYGLSEGLASQPGLYRDALSALDYSTKLLKERSYSRWIVYGQSLGGAVLSRAWVDFKGQDLAQLMVLDSTFASYRELALEKMKGAWPLYPFIPLAPFLISDEYAPKDYLFQIQTPTLVIHGKRDVIIPEAHGQEIFSLLKSKKWFWPVEKGNHIDGFHVDNQLLKSRFLSFLEQHVL